MTDHVQPDWSGAPDWANYWAVSNDGYAYWYRDQPKFDYDHEDGGVWLRPFGDSKVGGSILNNLWLRPWEVGESGRQFNNDEIKFDSDWPPEGFDDWDIDWSQTLRSRP